MSQVGTVYVAEDEPLAREALLHMLNAFPRWRVLGSAEDGEQAMLDCLMGPPDLLITDIRMPKLDGLELVASLRTELPRLHVVFVTAFDQHAVAAFRLAAVDYLLKPVSDGEFSACLDRAETQLRRQRLEELAAFDSPLDNLVRDSRTRLRRIVVRSIGRIDIVSLNDVIAFRATGNYVEVVTHTRRLLHRQTMKSLLEHLDPAEFMQTHRTAIVAVSHIRTLEKRSTGCEVVLDNGSRYPLSSRHHQRLAQRLALP